MALLTVQHAVRDFGAWRSIYDSLDEVQRDWGVTEASVHQLASEPDVVLAHAAVRALLRTPSTGKESIT